MSSRGFTISDFNRVTTCECDSGRTDAWRKERCSKHRRLTLFDILGTERDLVLDCNGYRFLGRLPTSLVYNEISKAFLTIETLFGGVNKITIWANTNAAVDGRFAQFIGQVPTRSGFIIRGQRTLNFLTHNCLNRFARGCEVNNGSYVNCNRRCVSTVIAIIDGIGNGVGSAEVGIRRVIQRAVFVDGHRAIRCRGISYR